MDLHTTFWHIQPLLMVEAMHVLYQKVNQLKRKVIR